MMLCAGGYQGVDSGVRPHWHWHCQCCDEKSKLHKPFQRGVGHGLGQGGLSTVIPRIIGTVT